MFTWLNNLLGGTSPITGYFGSLLIAGEVIKQVFVEQGMPQGVKGWFGFAAAVVTWLALRFAKDANKSNAPVPTSTPTTVG